MKIGIDARFYNETGVGRYLRNLISNLQALDKKNSYFIFLLPKDFQKFTETHNFKKVVAPFFWYGFAEQFNLPQLLSRYKLDLVHFPHFNVPIFYTGKFVVTIHDLIHQHHSMKRATTLNPFAFKIKQIGYKRVFKIAVSKSSKILVPSNFVKKLLITEWKVPDEKIIVTPEGVDGVIYKIADKITEKEQQKILDKFKIKGSFLFYVGNAHPHKNVEGLVKVFLKIQKKYADLKLVLSGYEHHFWGKIKRYVAETVDKSVAENIIFTDYITDEELVALYKGAKAFVLPSFEEGFGIPVLEAMACQCPVITSNTASLPEVGGDAVLYFNPADQIDMENKILKVLEDKSLAKNLTEKGKKRVINFSWKKMSEQTLQGYNESV